MSARLVSTITGLFAGSMVFVDDFTICSRSAGVARLRTFVATCKHSAAAGCTTEGLIFDVHMAGDLNGMLAARNYTTDFVGADNLGRIPGLVTWE